MENTKKEFALFCRRQRVVNIKRIARRSKNFLKIAYG